jgi:hypothetical protein
MKSPSKQSQKRPKPLRVKHDITGNDRLMSSIGKNKKCEISCDVIPARLTGILSPRGGADTDSYFKLSPLLI